MKITIESSTMTILVPANTNLGLIIAELKKIFPNDEWKDYNLQPEFEVTWTYHNSIPSYNAGPYIPHNGTTIGGLSSAPLQYTSPNSFINGNSLANGNLANTQSSITSISSK